MTVAEVLKSAGIADEVAAGLPKEVVAALTGFVSDADAKLSSAEEARRQAELEKNETKTYVEKYGEELTGNANLEAKNKALLSYLESLKAQGFDITIPGVSAEGKPVTKNEPAAFDASKFASELRGEVGNVMSQFLDANNEHIRLFGTPIPDSSTELGVEATRARKPIGQYIAEKYKFKDRQSANEAAEFQKKVNAEAAKIVAEKERERAEREGSNPHMRGGESSRSSFVRPIKGEEFHKSDGNQPARERHKRMLERIHSDVQAARSA